MSEAASRASVAAAHPIWRSNRVRTASVALGSDCVNRRRGRDRAGDSVTHQPKAENLHFGPFKTILFSTILTLAVFVLAEIGVRIWVGGFREPAERLDVATGTFVLQPGLYPRLAAPPLEVNSRSYLGLEFEEPPPSGTLRIVTIGDSCTFGEGSGDHTYPAQLEKRLNREGRQPLVQVINAGIEGMNSELALRRLSTKVVPLAPDIVTVYIGWND